DRKSTRLNFSHLVISYAVFCLKKKKRAPWPEGRKREGGRVVRTRLQSLSIHEPLCRMSLVPRPNTLFPAGFSEPESIPPTSGSTPFHILLCRPNQSGLTQTARPVESSCS